MHDKGVIGPDLEETNNLSASSKFTLLSVILATYSGICRVQIVKLLASWIASSLETEATWWMRRRSSKEKNCGDGAWYM